MKRFKEEEQMGLLDKDGIVQTSGMHKKEQNSDASDDNDSDSSSSEEQKVTEKKRSKKKVDKSTFRVNTSYCRSELELLQHVIYKNNLKETSIGG